MTAPWRIRPMTAEDTRDIVKLWLESWWSSGYARREYRREDGKRAFLDEHGPRLRAILLRAETRILCSVDSPDVFYAFAVVEGPDVVHTAFAKRSFHREGLSVDCFRELLADRLEKPCTVTHELPELHRSEVIASGFRVPESWRFNPYWTPTKEAA
jgi:hypothetical protein